ncbi:MAG: phage portal protein [Opitutales bacterium]|nr:phage portal protein [Opitutales bacterium]
MGLFGFFEKRRKAALEKELLDTVLKGLSSVSGVHVNPDKALGVSTVFACVDLLSKTVSTLPLKVYQKQSGGSRKQATNHPLHAVLHDSPNPEMTSADFLGAMQAHLSLRQQCYASIVRNNAGNVVQLWPLLPNKMQIRKDPEDDSKLIYIYDGKEMPRENVFDLRGLTHNGIQGLSLASTCNDVIGLAISLQDNAGRYFANDSKVSGFLKAPGILKEPTIKKLKKQITEATTGEKKYFPFILEEGIEFIRERSENKDSQFLESRQQQDKAIVQLFGIPPHKVGILDNATFSNIEHQNIEWVVDSLRPYLVRWEQRIKMQLLTKRERDAGFYVEFSVDGLLRGDIKSRYEAYQIGFRNGWLNQDTILAMENQNPLPDQKGQTYYVTADLVPAERAMNPQEPSTERQDAA